MSAANRRRCCLLGTVGVVVLGAMLLGQACGDEAGAACGPENCMACCLDGICRWGDEPEACGFSGTCAVCSIGQTCDPMMGICVASAACGNGTLDPGEECDDGNPADGDGCSSTCRVETSPDADADVPTDSSDGADAEPEADAETGADADADADVDADADADADADVDADVDADSSPDSSDGADAESEVDAETGADADADADADGGAITTLEQFCEAEAAFGQEWRDWYATCCSADDVDSLDFSFRAPYDADPYIADCVSRYQAGIDEGRWIFDASYAAACVAAREPHGVPAPPAGCTGLPWDTDWLHGHGRQYLQQIDSCRRMLAGHVARGAVCEGDLDCVPGATCYDAGTGAYRCYAMIGSGFSCSSDTDCLEGLFCEGEDGSKRCGPLSGVGGPCEFNNHCEDGLLCGSRYTSTPYECFRPVAVGALCGETGDCVPGAYCDTYTAHRCVAFPSLGEACFAGMCQGRCDRTADVCVELCGAG
jgi:cysteine-rich repeat protein